MNALDVAVAIGLATTSVVYVCVLTLGIAMQVAVLVCDRPFTAIACPRGEGLQRM